MCKFCEALKQQKRFQWDMRSTYEDDNICEVLNGNSCSMCNGCRNRFYIDAGVINGDVLVGVEYEQIVGRYNDDEAVIKPFSEYIQFNYCPVCGDVISKNIDKEMSVYLQIQDK